MMLSNNDNFRLRIIVKSCVKSFQKIINHFVFIVKVHRGMMNVILDLCIVAEDCNHNGKGSRCVDFLLKCGINGLKKISVIVTVRIFMYK